MTYRESINLALLDLLTNDPSVYVLGEDILDPYGGAFKVTKGLSSKFPDRVITTPISENGFVGVGAGMAVGGLHPIVEIMFGDFVALCFDQLLNHASKFGPMYAAQVTCPLVVRAPMGAGRSYGPTHSQALEKHMLGVPNLSIVAPSLLHDAGQLLKEAVYSNGPTLFIEGKLLYPLRLIDTIPDGWALHNNGLKFPIAQLQNFTSGKADVTIFTYGSTSRSAVTLLQRLEEEEIKARLAFISDLGNIDSTQLAQVAEGTNRGLLVWEEGTAGFTWGAELVAILAETGNLQTPIRRLASADTIIPAAKHLEDDFLATEQKAFDAVLALI